MQGMICPVDVISVCTADGKIRPLRFRIEDENAQWFRVDIDEVVKCQEISRMGAESQIFLCRATVWGRNWLFELKYSIRTHNWCILGRYH